MSSSLLQRMQYRFGHPIPVALHVRALVLAFGFVALASAQDAPVLTGVTRLTPSAIAAGLQVVYSISYTGKPSLVRLYVVDKVGSEHDLFSPIPTSPLTVTTNSDVGWLNGPHFVLGVQLSMPGSTIYYWRDGTVETVGSSTVGHHNLDFSSLQFDVSGGVDAFTFPMLNSVRRISAPVVTNSDVISLQVTYTAGNTPVRSITLDLTDARGTTRSIVVAPSADTSPFFVRTLDLDWSNGPCAVSRVSFLDSNSRSIAFGPDGSVKVGGGIVSAIFPGRFFGPVPGAPTAHSVDFQSNGFEIKSSARLSNLAVRASLGAQQVLIIGFVTQAPRDVLVRAAGPALKPFGVGNAMADPRIELYSESVRLTANDNWPAALAPAFDSVGAFPFAAGSLDAALLQNLNGPHSVQVRGGGAGVVLVEAYDSALSTDPGLVNISARGVVGIGEDSLIAGFTIAGKGSKQLLIRAVGPKLAAFGVNNFLVDPRLEIYDSSGTRITQNDNWSSPLSDTFQAVNAFALDPGSRDAAIVVSYPAGTYSAVVHGVGGTTGEALIEVYDVK